MEEDAFIDFDCPYCKMAVSYLSHYRGTAQGCPNCGEAVCVPRREGEPGRPIPIPLKTPRLVLRRFHPRDWKDALEYHSDEELFQYDSRHPQGEEEIVQWLEQDGRTKLTQPNQTFFLAVVDQQTDKVMGEVGLRILDAEHLQANVAVYLNRNFQKQGYGSEALAAMLVFCFRDIGLHRLVAVCDSRNEAALRMLAKVGLRKEGEFLQSQFIKEQWIDTTWFALLRGEYEKKLG